MTSKERVLTTFANQEADRVPINYAANGGIDRRLKEHFGLKANDGEGLNQALGLDFRGVGVGYKGPKLHEDIPERGVSVSNWGIHTRWIEHETGGYHDARRWLLLLTHPLSTGQLPYRKRCRHVRNGKDTRKVLKREQSLGGDA